MKLHRKQKSPTKIILLSTAALLLVGLGAYAFYAKQTDSWPFIPTSEDTKTRDADEVNYDPPTEQEIKDSQDAKQRGGAFSRHRARTFDSPHSRMGRIEAVIVPLGLMAGKGRRRVGACEGARRAVRRQARQGVPAPAS